MERTLSSGTIVGNHCTKEGGGGGGGVITAPIWDGCGLGVPGRPACCSSCPLLIVLTCVVLSHHNIMHRVSLFLVKVLEPEEAAPGAVQATPRPPMPQANQLEPKRTRMERWKKDPSEMEKDMAKQWESLARAEKEDAQARIKSCFADRGFPCVAARFGTIDGG